jgi:AcrR family transcriptional regulator
MKRKNPDSRGIILESALKVFSEEGFHNAKITKIADISKVAAGTVYLQFESKEQILEELFCRSWSEIEHHLTTLSQNDNLTAKQKIQQFIGIIISLVNEKKDIARLFLREYSFWNSDKSSKLSEIVQKSKRILHKIIDEGIASDNFRNDLSSDVATAYFIGGLWHIFVQYNESDGTMDLRLAQKDIENIVFKGFI